VSGKSKRAASGLDYATRFVTRICRIAGDHRMLDHIRRDLARCGVRAAVRGRNTPTLFEWLLDTVSYQGIGNHVAEGYMDRHGRLGWDEIAALIEARPSCPKLRSYWHFDHCGYRKGAQACSEPDHFPECPLPTHDLRNGRLNQRPIACSCSSGMSPMAISSAGSTGGSPMPILAPCRIAPRG
jgi:hypothetical protein